MDITNVEGEHESLKKTTKWFSNSALVEFCRISYLIMFKQGRVFLPGVEMNLKLVPSSNEFYINCAAPPRQKQQKRFKVVIKKSVLRIRTIELIRDAALGHNAILELEKSAIIPH